MSWISVETETPNTETLGGKQILILVNGKVCLCTVIRSPQYGYADAYLTDNNFLYSSTNGWCGDPRFAKPTHWMLLPESPKLKRYTAKSSNNYCLGDCSRNGMDET